MQQVPFTDLAAMTREVRPTVEADWAGCLHTADSSAVRPVDEFEQAWAAYCGAPHAVGVANGTDAIAAHPRRARHRRGR